MQLDSLALRASFKRTLRDRRYYRHAVQVTVSHAAIRVDCIARNPDGYPYAPGLAYVANSCESNKPSIDVLTEG